MSSTPQSEELPNIHQHDSLSDPIISSNPLENLMGNINNGEMKNETENGGNEADAMNTTTPVTECCTDQPIPPAAAVLNDPLSGAQTVASQMNDTSSNVDEAKDENKVANHPETNNEEHNTTITTPNEEASNDLVETFGDALQKEDMNHQDEDVVAVVEENVAVEELSDDALVEVLEESTAIDQILEDSNHLELTVPVANEEDEEVVDGDASQLESHKDAPKPKSILRAPRIVTKETKVKAAVKRWTDGPVKGNISMPSKPDPSNADATMVPIQTTASVGASEIQPEIQESETNIPKVANKKARESKKSTTTGAKKSPAKSPAKSVLENMWNDGQIQGEKSVLEGDAATPAVTRTSLNELSSPDFERTRSPRRRLTAAKSALKQPNKPGEVKSQLESETAPTRKRGRTRKSDGDIKPDAKKRKAKTEKSSNTTSSNAATKPSSSSSSGKSAFVPALEVWSGIPDDDLAGGWPDGWVKKKFQRQSGGTKGSIDRYWFSPHKQYRLRSMVEVRMFLSLLEKYSGEEDNAWNEMKNKKR